MLLPVWGRETLRRQERSVATGRADSHRHENNIDGSEDDDEEEDVEEEVEAFSSLC